MTVVSSFHALMSQVYSHVQICVHTVSTAYVLVCATYTVVCDVKVSELSETEPSVCFLPVGCLFPTCCGTGGETPSTPSVDVDDALSATWIAVWWAPR